MSVKKIVVVTLMIVVAVSGFAAGLYLLQEQQDLREKAAVSRGQANVYITPATGNFNVGDTISTEIKFNTSGIPISGIAVKLVYPFTGVFPEVSVTSIQIDQEFLSTGDWTCPTQNATQQGGNVLIDIACANTSSSGFSTNSDFKLATIQFRVNRVPSNNPFVLRFDPSESVITRRIDNQDILLIPQSQGTYTILSSSNNPSETATPTLSMTSTVTPSPVSPTNIPTLTLTSTPVLTSTSSVTLTKKVSKTSTPVPSFTVTPTSSTNNQDPTFTPTKSQLPDAGISMPTVLGVVFGILVLVFAVALAL
ncbi:MAG: hypothetical protein N2558_01700 [Patescibacteria group bacterium]|nr:hypothetical protein [Patescibacteria group bacterium]